jgi:hypothetical protein
MMLVKYKFIEFISEIPWTMLPDEGRGWSILVGGRAAAKGMCKVELRDRENQTQGNDRLQLHD